MSPRSTADPGRAGHRQRPGAIADLALVKSAQFWGAMDAAGFWERFHPEWRQALETAARSERCDLDGSPLEWLRAAHAAAARPDRQAVHSTWWVRALKTESPAVQRAVVAHADPALAALLQQALGLNAADLDPDHPPDTDALRWALGLWDERIVGDVRQVPDDPLVIVVLTSLNIREVVTLAQTAGLAKLALALETPPPLRRRFQDVFVAFRRGWAHAQASARAWAHADYTELVKSRHLPRRPGRTLGQEWARLGLVTFGRLLAAAEPYRARWALQHLPYWFARSVRPMVQVSPRGPTSSEARILRIAWDLLAVEGRIPPPPGELTHGS